MNLSFIVVNSRSEAHPDWFKQCMDSLQNCGDSGDEIIIVNNLKRELSIGKAFNEGVKQSKNDWVVFIGDDDHVEHDYGEILKKYITYIKDNPKYVCVATNMTVFLEETGDQYPLVRQSTGAWKRDYLLKFPFNENLEKGIDREYIEETIKRGDFLFIVGYYFGYYYRRHNDYRCAGDIIFHKKASDYYFVTTNRIFLSPITDRLSDYFVDTNYDYELAKQAKVIWVEWGNKKAIDVSNDKLPGKKILRVHAFEVFTEYAPRINWNGYDYVIFIDEYIKNYAERQFGKINGAIVIPNGVDLNKFTLRKGEKNNKIAYAGYLTRKKGIGELMLLAKSLPEYEFHLAGKYQENDIADWMNEKKPDNVFIYPWQYGDSMNEFYQDKSYVINTSMRESQAMTLMEGMACGLKPLVYDWIGAKEIYGDYVYKNIDELKQLLEGSYEPEEYRKFIEKNYNFEDKFEQIAELLRIEEWQHSK